VLHSDFFLAISFTPNSSNFSKSCGFAQFTARVDLLQVIADGMKLDAEQFGDIFLVEPKGLGFIENLDSGGTLRGAVENDVAFNQLRGLVHGSPRSNFPYMPSAMHIAAPGFQFARLLPLIQLFRVAQGGVTLPEFE
jgi:hypothetical protein